jgi:hypothetical protein
VLKLLGSSATLMDRILLHAKAIIVDMARPLVGDVRRFSAEVNSKALAGRNCEATVKRHITPVLSARLRLPRPSALGLRPSGSRASTQPVLNSSESEEARVRPEQMGLVVRVP